ncbi:MAG: beta-N-acetylhexosaminidase, partial [Clostridia bacterium]|nr:beta-N-acetylhexosaminidase [Clostridia bacterium]
MKYNLNELSKEEKIGQMLMVGMETNQITERTKALIQKYKIGGIILYKKNFSSYQEMISIVNQLKELNKENKIPLFIAIDQEGGRVNRLPKEFLRFPSANSLASQNDYNLIEKDAQILTRILANTGFNFNFAPVLDLKNFNLKHAIGDRAFSKDIDVVSKCGEIFVNKHKENNIVAVIKHFPGHGATKRDSHFVLPIVKKKIEQLEKEDMKPFENVINKGADAMLVGHLVIPKVSKLFPASLSRKFIYTYIRKRLKYNKLLVTDDLKMRAIRLVYGRKYAVKKAFYAGNDIIVFRFNKHQEKKTIESL